MDHRLVFTLDPDYFPLQRMREIVEYLHSHGQRYSEYNDSSGCEFKFILSIVFMIDPAVGYRPGEGYESFDRGTAADIWLKAANGSSPYLGLSWPGVSVWPDWFNEKVQEYVHAPFQYHHVDG